MHLVLHILTRTHFNFTGSKRNAPIPETVLTEDFTDILLFFFLCFSFNLNLKIYNLLTQIGVFKKTVGLWHNTDNVPCILYVIYNLPFFDAIVIFLFFYFSWFTVFCLDTHLDAKMCNWNIKYVDDREFTGLIDKIFPLSVLKPTLNIYIIRPQTLTLLTHYWKTFSQVIFQSTSLNYNMFIWITETARHCNCNFV